MKDQGIDRNYITFDAPSKGVKETAFVRIMFQYFVAYFQRNNKLFFKGGFPQWIHVFLNKTTLKHNIYKTTLKRKYLLL